jgi:hypothetical protein
MVKSAIPEADLDQVPLVGDWFPQMRLFVVQRVKTSLDR